MKLKYLLKYLLLAVGIGILIGVTYIAIRLYQIEYRYGMAKDIDYEKGVAYCFARIKKEMPELRDKKYFYFCHWGIHCKPCVEEISILDSLADSLSKNIACIQITEDSDENVRAFLKRKKIISRNFSFLNDMDPFISAIYRKKGFHYKAFPTQIVIDAQGRLLYFNPGSVSPSMPFKLSAPDSTHKQTITKEQIAWVEQDMQKKVGHLLINPLIPFLKSLH